MNSSEERLESDRRELRAAQAKGGSAVVKTYLRLSGPGWLQSAITLGGGSLTGSLYLGVLAGFGMLWLQPVAMIFGIIMLSAIGYVTMSTGKRPFQAINEHINPVLGWGWAIASLVASMVWALPQYSLANGVLQQNLFPGLLGPNGPLGDFNSKLLISISILVISTLITWSYGNEGRGVKLYEIMLKVMVGVIVLCFFGVVFKMAMSPGGLAWGPLLKGFLPDLSTIFRPAVGFNPLLAAVAPEHREFWSKLIVDRQRDVMMTAAATAVGINMTFLFPYSILARRWTREFRGLSIFDLSTGMFIPFVLATSCVIIAAANQFHTVPQPGFIASQTAVTPSGRQLNEFNSLLTSRLSAQAGGSAIPAEELAERIATVPEAERHIAATLVTRDAFDLAQSLKPLTGDLFGDVIFGIGVLGMTLSTITILMLISGFVVCEMLGLPASGWPHRLGTLAAATGALGPFLWSKAAFWLAVPTSIFGLILLPIAYWTFYLMMNSDSLLGADRPQGRKKIIWNTLMGTAATISTIASLTMVWIKTGYKGMGAIGLFLLAAAIAHFLRKKPKATTPPPR